VLSFREFLSLRIGGKSKEKRQVSGEKEAYLVRDDTVSGFDRIIPLWAFGFLY